jgi:hypothetical protein
MAGSSARLVHGRRDHEQQQREGESDRKWRRMGRSSGGRSGSLPRRVRHGARSREEDTWHPWWRHTRAWPPHPPLRGQLSSRWQASLRPH